MARSYRTSIFAVVSCLLASVSADPSYFKYPPASGPAGNTVNDIVVTKGSTIELQWYSNISDYSIHLWQQGADDNSANELGVIYKMSGNGDGDQTYNWVVDNKNGDLSRSNIFFLWAGGDSGDVGDWACHYFNINPPTSSISSMSSTTTAAGPTSSTMTGSMTTSASTTSSSSSTSSTTSATSTPSAAASSSASTVGLGVGLGIGIPLALIAAGFLGLKYLKQRRDAAPVYPATPIDKSRGYEGFTEYAPQNYNAQNSYVESHPSYQQGPVYEVSDGRTSPAEAPGESAKLIR